MRTNRFGEIYCHTADEAREIIEQHGDDVYVPGDPTEPKDGEQATCEVADSECGDLICYIEAPTAAAVQAIIDELKLEVA